MPIYIIDGQEYEVNDSNRQIFESAFGDLEQYKVAGPENFQQDPADAETIVGSENNTVSNSENGLLVSPELEISPIDKLRQKYSKESLIERMPTVQIDNTAVNLPKKIIDPIKMAERS